MNVQSRGDKWQKVSFPSHVYQGECDRGCHLQVPVIKAIRSAICKSYQQNGEKGVAQPSANS